MGTIALNLAEFLGHAFFHQPSCPQTPWKQDQRDSAVGNDEAEKRSVILVQADNERLGVRFETIGVRLEDRDAAAVLPGGHPTADLIRG